jgi:large subunit ribosomal protein L6
MSRIGRRPVAVPAGVTVTIDGSTVQVKGPKGELTRTFNEDISFALASGELTVSRPSDEPRHRALHGLSRTLVANMVEGVTKGFVRTLEIQGVGYRAELVGKALKIAVGFSHPIIIKPVPGISVVLDDPTHFKVVGMDKELVGMMASKIRGFRPPEPYKGKGIRYKGEAVRKKAGKTAA